MGYRTTTTVSRVLYVTYHIVSSHVMSRNHRDTEKKNDDCDDDDDDNNDDSLCGTRFERYKARDYIVHVYIYIYIILIHS